MSLFLQRNIPQGGELGIWHIEEPSSFFFHQLVLTPSELAQVEQIKGDGRRLEWLATRYLLHIMSGRAMRGACLKDEFGKPYLEQSPYHISISHSTGMAAVIAAPFLVGIDIQKLVTKIERIAHKFMRPQEMESLEDTTRLEHLHVYWGAKEALYKAYGRKALDFREHILVSPFVYDLHVGKCEGMLKKDNFQIYFDIYYEKIMDYMLVYVLKG